MDGEVEYGSPSRSLSGELVVKTKENWSFNMFALDWLSLNVWWCNSIEMVYQIDLSSCSLCMTKHLLP